MPGELSSKRLEQNDTRPKMQNPKRLEQIDTRPEMPRELSPKRLEPNDTGAEIPGKPSSKRLEKDETGPEMPGEPSPKGFEQGKVQIKRTKKSKRDAKKLAPVKTKESKEYASLETSEERIAFLIGKSPQGHGKDKKCKEAKKNRGMKGKEGFTTEKKQHKKKNAKNMREVMRNILMDHKVLVKSILDLCPRFKEKVLKAWVAELNQEIKEMEGEAKCNMAQREEALRTRDDNVAKIRMTIGSSENKG